MNNSLTLSRTFRQLFLGLAIICSLVLLSSCGSTRMSREYSQAREAINKQDWPTARELLEQEVGRNSSNSEAWYYLGFARQKLGDLKGMNAAYTMAEKGVNDAFKITISQARFSAWAEMFNTSVEIYNRYAETADSSRLEKGIETMKSAIELKPELPENYSMLGMLYDARRDTASAIAAYEKYASMQEPALNLAKSKGLFIAMPRTKAIETLGVTSSSQTLLSGSDSLAIDIVKGQDTLYLYSVLKDKTGYTVEGWRVNPPSGWTTLERERYAPLNVRPFAQLASIYYNRHDLDKALRFVDIIATLKPSDELAQNLRVQIFADQGKVNQALDGLAELVRRDPTNKSYISNYALALLRQERYDDAVAQYEKALAIDADYDVALINCAAALKNRAVQIQREEREHHDKDPKYKENDQRYFPLLTKSAEYFDRYRRLSSHRDDMAAMEHLVNIYETVGDKTKLKQVVSELEAMEYSNVNNARYWDILGGVYSRAKQADRADRAFKKADEARSKSR